MANGRNFKSRVDASRIPGPFSVLPWAVLDSIAFGSLSHPARSLLVEFARQIGPSNNGRLLASRAYLSKRSWTSTDVITRAKRELLKAGFIFETVKGQRPNKASWYAVTWRTLDKIPGYDTEATICFERSAYDKNDPLKITRLKPSRGVGRPSIAPSRGVVKEAPTPSHGAIKPTFVPLSTPSHGNHLDMPSPELKKEVNSAQFCMF